MASRNPHHPESAEPPPGSRPAAEARTDPAYALLESLEDGYFELDLAGRLTECNRALCELTGYSRQELIGQNYRQYADADTAERLFRTFTQVYRSGQPIRKLGFELIHRDGTQRSVEISVSLVRDPGEQPTGFRGVPRDISDRKQAEAATLRRNAELAALNLMAQALRRLGEPSELLELIYIVMGTVLDSHNLYIALYEEATQSISFPVYTTDGERVSRPERPIGNGMTDYVIRTKAPLYLPRDVASESSARGIAQSERPVRCYVAVPMLVGDKVSGVIAIQDYEREDVYDSGHMELLSTLAAQAAIAFENARLFAETERLARTDPLTGIANRRTLFEVGARELRRARRFRHPLSIVMLDVDHFKLVNDGHGHATGDQVLRHIAQCCQDYIRDSDLVARYGGEEFVILLIETDGAGALRSAERLRDTVAESVFESAHGAFAVTISMGVAEAKLDDETLATLLRRSDQALYAAKHAGGNRVERG